MPTRRTRILADLPTVNCGTCAFHDDTRCALRDVRVDSPSTAVCANHPEYSPDRAQLPIGPVLAAGDGVRVVSPSADTRAIRQNLMEVIDEVDLPDVSLLSFREAAAFWQLERFGDRSAAVHLDRIRVGAGLEAGEFDLLEYARGLDAPAGGNRIERPWASPRSLGIAAMTGLCATGLANLIVIAVLIHRLGLIAAVDAGTPPGPDAFAADETLGALAGSTALRGARPLATGCAAGKCAAGGIRTQAPASGRGSGASERGSTVSTNGLSSRAQRVACASRAREALRQVSRPRSVRSASSRTRRPPSRLSSCRFGSASRGG